MKSKKLFIAISLFAFCSNPTSNIEKESIITCLNGFAFVIRYNHYPQGKCPEYFTNEITMNNWTTLDLQFNLKDSLKGISFSPSRNDTMCFDTIWAEDTNHNMHIYTFENVTTYDTTGQLMFGSDMYMGTTVIWKKLDTKTFAFYPVGAVSDTTYDAVIGFMHPIISNGHVKIRIKSE
ncbi:MAG: hypothetical protein ABSF80_02700 [Chitinispirillaceae bacterium]|jgi:hypothetical protein